jgi:TatD DNase family protein
MEPASADILINIHTHSAVSSDILSVQNISPTEINENVKNSNEYYSIGFHPWDIEKYDDKYYLSLIENKIHLPRVIAIGECGLDKSIAISLKKQEEIFITQVKLSEKAHKPMLIHCVRAYNELLVFRKNSNTKMPWIFHGFNGSYILASQLIQEGCYISFGKALLQHSNKLLFTLQHIPIERLLLETDVAEISIQEVYHNAASLLGTSLINLKKQISENFNTIFANQYKPRE